MSTRSLNRAQLIGHLGQDPDLRLLNSGMAVCNVSVATSASWTDKNTGELREETEWHRISLWGKLAEIANQYLRKGDKVYLEGKLKTRKWQDQQGQERYTTEIHADQMIMLGGRSPEGEGRGPAPAQGQARPGPGNGPLPQPGYRGQTLSAQDTPDQFDFADDIPF